MPFDAGKILSTRSFDENTPVQATVRLPRSSVNFLRQFVPAVEQLDGDVAFDVAIGGTIARPAFNGSGDITINAARFTDATLPALHGFQSRLIFRDNARDAGKISRRSRRRTVHPRWPGRFHQADGTQTLTSICAPKVS